MKEQFKATRRQLIESMKALRESRNALKGLKGVSAKWDELTKQMDATQDKIDTLSLALGYPVKERVANERNGKFEPKGVVVARTLYSKPNHCEQPTGRMGRKHAAAEVVPYKGRVVVGITESELPTDAYGNIADLQCGNYLTLTKANPSK